MKQLITIQEHNGNNAVSARELHKFLEVKDKFTDWIKRMLEYGFVENTDYQGLSDFSEKPKGGRPSIDYALSIDCAKEISMIQRTEKGKQARQYFIECEKIAKQNALSAPRSHKEVILSELRLLEENEKLITENGRLQERTQFVDTVFKSDDLLTISQAAKTLNLNYGRNTLCKTLREKGVFFKNSNEPKQEYLKRGYFRVKEKIIGERSSGEAIIAMQTFITQKGLGFIAKTIGVVIPQIKRIKTA
ncbi:antA/AntB antirepressor family protein [Chryseobacterium cucumeris]|uniref:antA/AntB antirepressor family protein n=1 Tax=Chryseobacterium cucumeris TaxID=1813611 RepID=UPI0032098428